MTSTQGPREDRVAALVLAAGGSSRLGRPKQLVEWEGEPLVRRVVRLAREAEAAPVLVVLGAAAKECRAALAGLEMEILEHAGWAEGMGSSLAAGARALRESTAEFAGLLVLLCDQPAVTAAGLRGLLATWREDPASAIISTFGAGAQGPPAVFPRAWLDELAALSGDEGARAILRRRPSAARRLPFPAAARDLDTPADLAQILADTRGKDFSCNNQSDIQPSCSDMNTIPSDLLLGQLRWRYATKQFDPAKKILVGTWSALEEALRLSASSYGLQPWKFVVITDQALKEKLPAISWDQPQARDCSHYVVFAVKKGLDQAWVDRYVARISEVRGVPAEKLGAFRGMMLGSLDQAGKDGSLDSWQTHQVYIALGTFLSAAALLGVDTCPMEGISRPEFDKLLGLETQGFTSVCGAAAGYRLDSDPNAHLAKVRFPAAEVIDHR